MRLVSTDNDAKKKSFGVLHFFFMPRTFVLRRRSAKSFHVFPRLTCKESLRIIFPSVTSRQVSRVSAIEISEPSEVLLSPPAFPRRCVNAPI